MAWAEGLVRGDPVPVSELAGVLRPLREAGVDTVVLGCTHYPLLLASLRQALPEVVHWVDSGEAIARRVSYLLAQGAWPMAPLRDQRAYPPVEAVLLSGEAGSGCPNSWWSLTWPPAGSKAAGVAWRRSEQPGQFEHRQELQRRDRAPVATVSFDGFSPETGLGELQSLEVV